MSLRPSHLITLTMSVMWVARLILGSIRWLRSPSPVIVGVNTLWPFFSRRSVTRRQHQPPCQAPCTSTKVFTAPCACAVVASIMVMSPAPAAMPPSMVRRDCPFSSVIVSSTHTLLLRSGHLQQDVDQPSRRVDHHVVTGVGGFEGLPGLVGLALRQGLVE